MLCERRGMYGRHNPGASTGRGCGLSVLPKPPKPPSWRDFEQRQNGAKNIDFTDLNRVHRSGQDLEIGRHHGHTHSSHTKPAKRTKAKIHRTRSQMMIHQSEIPDVGVTVTLAETHPKEIGLRKKYYSDERIYLDQNHEKCREWLAGVRACEPLEDVAFSQGTGVEVEVPEESSQWTNLEIVRPHISSSDSSSECEPPDRGGGGVNSSSKRTKQLEKVISPRQEQYRPSTVPSEDLEMGDSKLNERIREVKVSPRSTSGKQGSVDGATTRGGSPRSGAVSTTVLGSQSSDLPRVEVHTGLS
ncbi:uncharacterized protein LOC135489148 [Lineus longissimus]|uniref:uncharacterized protein LOC135489148 n=1 Tax=Lineus longissimus TaxID=88925 RepID=UPI00315DD618